MIKVPLTFLDGHRDRFNSTEGIKDEGATFCRREGKKKEHCDFDS